MSLLIPPFPRLSACEPSCCPMYKCAQRPLHNRGHHPRLRPKQQHLLHHRLEEVTRHPFCCALPAKDPLHPLPTLPDLCQIPRHLRPVLIPLCQDPPQVFKPRDRLNLFSVDLEGHPRAVPDLRLRQSPSLLVHPTPVHLCALVAAV